MNIGNVNRTLIAKANRIGQKHINNMQTKLSEILQDAAPDGAVVTDGNIVHIAARRLFDRMMTNEKLRSPQSFLQSFMKSSSGHFSGRQNPRDGEL